MREIMGGLAGALPFIVGVATESWEAVAVVSGAVVAIRSWRNVTCHIRPRDAAEPASRNVP